MKNIILAFIIAGMLANCGGCSSGAGYTAYSIGGTVSGLVGTVVLQNNGGDDQSISENGAFTFTTKLSQDEAYEVAITTQPTGETCHVTNGSNTVSSSNVTDVTVSCHDSSLFSVGGSVSGLSGTVVLQNNSGDDLSVTADGSFTFSTALEDGDEYAVTVKIQPDGQSCSLSKDSGTISSASVTNVTVACVDSGTLDTSFGNNGVVTYDGGGADHAYAITLDSSGRILVAGQINNADDDGYDMAILRFDTDGTLDTSFGDDGVVLYDGGYRHDCGLDILEDDDGNILVCGRVNESGSSLDMTIWRYTSSGEVDSLFGVAGVVSYVDSGSDICGALAIDVDDNIMAGGTNGGDLALWRYDSDGNLDASFDDDGKVTYNTSTADDRYALSIDSGDNIFLAGTDTILYYDQTGTLINGFGDSGVVTVTGELYGMALDSAENILVGGYSTGGDKDDMTVWKYFYSGSLDTSYGESGLAIVSGADDSEINGMIIDDDDRVIAVGDDGADLYVLRYTDEGALDTNFDSDGIAIYDGGNVDSGQDVVRDDDGNIYVLGIANNGTDDDIVILKYYP